MAVSTLGHIVNPRRLTSVEQHFGAFGLGRAGHGLAVGISESTGNYCAAPWSVPSGLRPRSAVANCRPVGNYFVADASTTCGVRRGTLVAPRVKSFPSSPGQMYPTNCYVISGQTRCNGAATSGSRLAFRVPCLRTGRAALKRSRKRTGMATAARPARTRPVVVWSTSVPISYQLMGKDGTNTEHTREIENGPKSALLLR